MFGPGGGGHCWPQTSCAVRRTWLPPCTGAVSVAGTEAGCQSVAGLPSTAASGSAPTWELLADAGWQRTMSGVGVRSGRRVDMVRVPPLETVLVPDGPLTVIDAPLSSFK